MKARLRRFLYLLFFIVWLLVMSFPVVAVVLAARHEIQLGSDPRSHLRLFLVQERRAEGVGLEWTRRVRKATGCSQTSVVYLMWKGEGKNVIFCQCYDDDGTLVSSAPKACDPT